MIFNDFFLNLKKASLFLINLICFCENQINNSTFTQSNKYLLRSHYFTFEFTY